PMPIPSCYDYSVVTATSCLKLSLSGGRCGSVVSRQGKCKSGANEPIYAERTQPWPGGASTTGVLETLVGAALCERRPCLQGRAIGALAQPRCFRGRRTNPMSSTSPAQNEPTAVIRMECCTAKTWFLLTAKSFTN